jgi:predicted CXXCH cytochrome family protein
MARCGLTFLAVLTAALAGGGVACKAPRDASGGVPTASLPGAHAGRARVVSSNIMSSDYAGSAACRPCHTEIADSFRASPMHRMTRNVDGAEIDAPFDGTTFQFKGDTATLLRHAEQRFVRLESKESPPRLYRVTRVIGGRYREDFAGIEVSSETDAESALGRDELILPVSFLRFSRTLRYKGYSVMVHERSHLEAGPVWNRTCIFCHNTVPYLSVLLGELAGKHAPHFQGEVVDDNLPNDRAFRYTVVGEKALGRAVADEVARLGGPPVDTDQPLRELLRSAVDTTRNRFTGARLLEIGIGCESCHGGSGEHARDPTTVPSFEPRAPFLAIQTPEASSHGDARAQQINHVCARCHQVLFSRYPWTWEGGRRRALPGGSHINSGEGRDFLLGGCSSSMTCSRCHDPHAKDDRVRTRAIETASGNAVCLGCHAVLRGAAAQTAHSHHMPDGAGGACVACHMPKKNMALDGRLTRYHRIGSPTDPLRVLGDRPLECALCHADKTVEELVLSMERWWHKSYDRQALKALYGDLGANAMIATLERGKPHEQAPAMAILGDRHDPSVAPLIAHELTNEYPLVREFARTGLENALGRPCAVRLNLDDATIESDASACLRVAGLTPRPWPARAELREAAEPPED